MTKTATLLFLLLSLFVASAADTNGQADLSKSLGDAHRSDTREYTRRADAAMDQWRADRFGIMIHWGVYAIPGGWWNGQEVKYAAEWIKVGGHVPAADYDALLPQFNPTNYHPQAWAKLFKAAGAKYVVITTKHHDGFCLWDSKFTDYDIGGTPWKKDLLRPLAEALRAEGIDCRLPTGGSFRLHPYGKAWAYQETPRADDVHRRGMFLGNAPYDISDKIEKAVRIIRATLKREVAA